jgi:hypothetical protein
MVRYPFEVLRAVSLVEPLSMNGKANSQTVRPEVHPPSAAPEATRVSKGERDVFVGKPFVWFSPKMLSPVEVIVKGLLVQGNLKIDGHP